MSSRNFISIIYTELRQAFFIVSICCREKVRKDMAEWASSGQWPLSCYAAFANEPCLGGTVIFALFYIPTIQNLSPERFIHVALKYSSSTLLRRIQISFCIMICTLNK